MTETEKIMVVLNKILTQNDKILNALSSAKKAETAAKKNEVEVVRFWVTAQELSKHTKFRGSHDYNRAREQKLIFYEKITEKGKQTKFRYDLNSVHPDFKL